MQFDQAIQGSHADLFRALREIFLGIDELHEVITPKQTTFKDPHNMAIVMLQARDNDVRLSFARGVQLAKKYSCLMGEGKVVRHIAVKTREEIDTLPLREMIRESLILAMEHRERQKMRRGLPQ